MKKLIIAVVLIVLGVACIVAGSRRSDSIAGISDEVGAKLANKWDGKARQPEHVWYYAAGGVFVLAGLVVALRKGA